MLLIGLAGAQAEPQAGKSSTMEERTKAVEIARSLESDPLGKHAKEQRAWIIRWLIEVPDINVKVCSKLLDPLVDSKKNYANEIFMQMLPASAAFVISNPEKAKDNVAVYGAALEGSLRVYEAILKIEPKARRVHLDDLVEKRGKGDLAEHVRQAATHCK